MAGALVARTWALLHDVHQLSLLAAGAGARTRARRTRRLAKVRRQCLDAPNQNLHPASCLWCR